MSSAQACNFRLETLSKSTFKTLNSPLCAGYMLWMSRTIYFTLASAFLNNDELLSLSNSLTSIPNLWQPKKLWAKRGPPVTVNQSCGSLFCQSSRKQEACSQPVLGTTLSDSFHYVSAVIEALGPHKKKKGLLRNKAHQVAPKVMNTFKWKRDKQEIIILCSDSYYIVQQKTCLYEERSTDEQEYCCFFFPFLCWESQTVGINTDGATQPVGSSVVQTLPDNTNASSAIRTS